MLPDILSYLMPLRIRARTLRRLSELSPIQIIMLVIAASISVVVSVFLAKKKPEWNGTVNKIITIVVMVLLGVPALLLFKG